MTLRRPKRGFTLVELVLVMVLLSAIAAIVAPSLSRFVRGRSLTEESRRFLALTRYARSEAASLGVPMELWLSPEEGKYGVQPAPGFESDKKDPLEFQLADGLKFDLGDDALDDRGRALIRFAADGDIEADSLTDVTIREDETHAVEIARAETGMRYEIREQ